MYAKTLVPSDPPVPMLVATTSEPKLLEQLAGFGFLDPASGGHDHPLGRSVELVIDHTRLALVVDGQVLLEDGAPAGPDGWWPAVDVWGQRCQVWITTGPLDLASADAGQQIMGLMATPGASTWAMVPVRHSAPETSGPRADVSFHATDPFAAGSALGAVHEDGTPAELTAAQRRALDMVREALPGTTPEQRALMVEELSRVVYDHVKRHAPGGEGLDGMDGPERRSLGRWVDAAIKHHFDWKRA